VRDVQADLLESVEDSHAPLRVVVGGDHLLRLVEEPDAGVLLDGRVDAALGGDLNQVAAVHQLVLHDGLSVHLHHPPLDHLLRRPP
jgi:hypothetical protein